MRERPQGNLFRTTVVCVDSYENSVLAGRFYNPGNEGGKTFSSLIQFLTQMEAMLNELRIPQSFSEVRAFGAFHRKGEDGTGTVGGQQAGKLATFSVRLLFRQNASWQGSVSWLEGRQEESFRSVLELVLLMDSALRARE